MVELINNNGKVWHSFENGYVKGFAFDGDVLLEGEGLYEVMAEAVRTDCLSGLLIRLNGNFAALITIDGKCYLIVDKLRSYPLFYSVSSGLHISDSGREILSHMEGERSFHEQSVYEFLALGYLSGEHTLIKDIHSVEAGSYVVIGKGQPTSYSYVAYMPENKLTDLSFVKERAAEVLEERFSKMLDTIKGRPVLLPLSGGYDSRLIACLCKKFALEDVTCFTYGREDSFEVEMSRKVARQLGFKWYFVEYTFDLWKCFLESEEFKDYCSFAGNLTANPHFQDFPALLELKRLGVLRKDMVVIPGHSGDLLGGSKIPAVFLENRRVHLDSLFESRLIYDEFYNLNVLKPFMRKQLIERIKLSRTTEKYNNQDAFLDDYETWFIKSKVANFLVNSMRGYEYFGLDWRLPLWDDEYIKVWYSVPWKEKYYSRFYDEFMFECYFEKYGVAFRKNRGVTNTGFANRMKRALPLFLNHWLREGLQFIRNLRQQKNVNAFDDVAQILCNMVSLEAYEDVQCVKRENINAVVAYYYLDLLRNNSIGI